MYNGERYLAQAFDSLLAQEYRNLELIVSDNASTDATLEICERYASRSSRIRYERAAENKGAIWNFSHVLDMARGEYFMWAAYDDLRDPAYVRACVNALQSRPDAVLACTAIRFIDEDGAELSVPRHLIGLRPTGDSARKRLRKIARSEHWYDFYGLTKTSTLRSTRGPVATWGFDVVVLLEVCVRGPAVLVDRPLFQYRRFRAKSPDDLASTLAAGTTPMGIPVCWTCLAVELLRGIWLSPHPFATRVTLLASFVLNFCLLNHAVAAAIKTDLPQNVREAWRGRRWARTALLLALGALIYPLHNSLTRAVYRTVRRSSPKPQAEHA